MEIIGYPNYLIYPDGKVWSNNVKRYLKPKTDRDGYREVNLVNVDGISMKKVHRLVGQHYIPNPENKPQIDHKNRTPSDNCVENLRWVTPEENQANTKEPCKYKNNTSGHKNISKKGDGYLYKKTKHKITHQRYFKTLEEAIEYKLLQ